MKNLKAGLERQAAHYHNAAATYEKQSFRENSNHFYKIEEIGKLIFPAADRENKKTVLEIGAGTGIHAEYFFRHYGSQISEFYLNDISKEMLEEAKKRINAENTFFDVQPAETLQINKKFDAIYVSGAMHHFVDPKLALQSIRKHLSPGGKLVICEPIVWNPVNFVRAAISPLDWNQFKLTKEAMPELLKSTGYTVKSNRVLHWRGGSSLLQTLWPFQKLEASPWLDNLAIMFLFEAETDPRFTNPA